MMNVASRRRSPGNPQTVYRVTAVPLCEYQPPNDCCAWVFMHLFGPYACYDYPPPPPNGRYPANTRLSSQRGAQWTPCLFSPLSSRRPPVGAAVSALGLITDHQFLDVQNQEVCEFVQLGVNSGFCRRKLCPELALLGVELGLTTGRELMDGVWWRAVRTPSAHGR